ncbi:unnamed protein product, partial [Prorocentrum cordatum]
PVAKQAPWRRVAREPTRDSLRDQILQNRQEFEAAKAKGSSEPAAQACSAASVASTERAPEADRAKSWKCSDPKCRFKNVGFREHCWMCTASAPPHILEQHPAIRRRAVQGVPQEPKEEEPQGAARLKAQQEGFCTKEEGQRTMKERAISCRLEGEIKCFAQSVLERRPDSVLTSRPAASTCEMVPPETKKNRNVLDYAFMLWRRQVVRDRGCVSTGGNAYDFNNFKGNGVAEQSLFWGPDTLGSGTNNGEGEEKDHGPNPVGAGLYGHVGGGDLGSDAYDLDGDEEFTSGIPDLPAVPPWHSVDVETDVVTDSTAAGAKDGDELTREHDREKLEKCWALFYDSGSSSDKAKAMEEVKAMLAM